MKYYYSNNGITAYLMRDVRKKEPKNECPLRFCVTYKRKRVYYSTGKFLNQKDWIRFENAEESSFNFKTKALVLKEIKNEMSYFFDNKLKPSLNELKNNFSFDALNIELGKSNIRNVDDAFQNKIEKLKNEGRVGNSTIYQTVKNSLENYKGNNILFSDITAQFLNKYEKYLSDNDVKTATISLYMRTLRAIINNEGKPFLKDDAYPFGKGKYLIKNSKGAKKLALTLKQIHQIEQFDCKDQQTDFCRDLWLFSFYASGINYTDIFRMKYSDIVLGELNFVRYKTRNTKLDETYISIPILEPMKKFIQKYGNKSKTGLIFPICNDCKIETDKRKKICAITHESNKRIKAICRELKNDDGTLMIPDYDLVNNYTARHSYATILNGMGVPESYIGQQLGHSKQTVTQGYFDGFDRDLRFKYNSLLLNPDNDNKIVFMNVT